MRKIIFTGGGSGGHVVPALTLIAKLKSVGFHVSYIGNHKQIEAELTKGKVDTFYSVPDAKLRRYFSWQNFLDFFKFQLAVIKAFIILLSFPRKTLIFSMGGFVSLPTVIAGFMQGKTIYIHEQTTRVGLANKIASYFATKVFISFEGSKPFFPKNKTELVGYPVRASCYTSLPTSLIISNRQVLQNKKIFFITGGGNGSELLNKLIEKNLTWLSENYLVIHQVGKQFIDYYKKYESDSYLPLPFLGEEIIDLFKLSDIVMARSGAGTVAELLAIGRRSIFIPLKIAQKNEQYHNAIEAKKILGSLVITEDEISTLDFKKIINEFSPTLDSSGHKEHATELLIQKVTAFYS